MNDLDKTVPVMFSPLEQTMIRGGWYRRTTCGCAVNFDSGYDGLMEFAYVPCEGHAGEMAAIEDGVLAGRVRLSA